MPTERVAIDCGGPPIGPALLPTAGLPSVSGNPRYASFGELVTTAADWLAMRRRAPICIDKVLADARPADLPIERPSRFSFVADRNSAQAIGLTILKAVLHQATNVHPTGRSVAEDRPCEPHAGDRHTAVEFRATLPPCMPPWPSCSSPPPQIRAWSSYDPPT